MCYHVFVLVSVDKRLKFFVTPRQKCLAVWPSRGRILNLDLEALMWIGQKRLSGLVVTT